MAVYGKPIHCLGASHKAGVESLGSALYLGVLVIAFSGQLAAAFTLGRDVVQTSPLTSKEGKEARIRVDL